MHCMTGFEPLYHAYPTYADYPVDAQFAPSAAQHDLQYHAAQVVPIPLATHLSMLAEMARLRKVIARLHTEKRTLLAQAQPARFKQKSPPHPPRRRRSRRQRRSSPSVPVTATPHLRSASPPEPVTEPTPGMPESLPESPSPVELPPESALLIGQSVVAAECSNLIGQSKNESEVVRCENSFAALSNLNAEFDDVEVEVEDEVKEMTSSKDGNESSSLLASPNPTAATAPKKKKTKRKTKAKAMLQLKACTRPGEMSFSWDAALNEFSAFSATRPQL